MIWDGGHYQHPLKVNLLLRSRAFINAGRVWCSEKQNKNLFARCQNSRCLESKICRKVMIPQEVYQIEMCVRKCQTQECGIGTKPKNVSRPGVELWDKGAEPGIHDFRLALLSFFPLFYPWHGMATRIVKQHC